MSFAGCNLGCNSICSSLCLKYKYELKSDVGRVRKKWIILFSFLCGIKNYWTSQILKSFDNEIIFVMHKNLFLLLLNLMQNVRKRHKKICSHSYYLLLCSINCLSTQRLYGLWRQEFHLLFLISSLFISIL